MPDMALIGGLANSLNIAVNISKLAIGLRDQALIQEKIVELTSEIMSAQQSAISAIATQTTLTERVRDLEKQIMDMEAWETEKQRYEMKIAARGATVYAVKEDARGAEPPHWICTNCYQQRKKSILQAAEHGEPGPDFQTRAWRCVTCGSGIRVPSRTSPTHEAHASQL